VRTEYLQLQMQTRCATAVRWLDRDFFYIPYTYIRDFSYIYTRYYSIDPFVIRVLGA
jgi:hypothetical protein